MTGMGCISELRRHESTSNNEAPACSPDCKAASIDWYMYDYFLDADNGETSRTGLRMRMLSTPHMRYHRYVVRSFLDVIVACGSSIGLFTGASLLSIIEFFIHLLLPTQRINFIRTSNYQDFEGCVNENQQTMTSTVISNNTPLHEIINQAEALKLTKYVSSQNAQLVRYHLRPYSDKMIGALGAHFQLLLEIQSEEQSSIIENQSLFVKTAPYHNPTEAAYVSAKRVLEQESTFFHNVVPQLMKHVDVGRYIPKCFLAKSDTLVFEDLATKGYSMRGLIFDEETTRSALRSVARLHASSILAETRLEKSLYELYPNAFREMTFTGDGKNHGWFLAAIDAAITVADSLGLNSSKITAIFDRLQQIVTEERETPLNDQTKWKVASHGDLWANNIIFDNNQPPNCILVNFQCTRYASPAQDVLLLLHLCTTREFRQQFEPKMIEFYHSTLRSLAYRYNPAARVLSIGQLKNEIEEQRLRAVVSAVVYFQTTMLNKKFAADVLEDAVEYDKFQYCDRRQKVMELMQRDASYRHRVEESVRELVDYSERYF